VSPSLSPPPDFLKILITGAGGLLGRYLICHLGRRHKVVGLDRNLADFDHPGRWICLDLMDDARLEKVMAKESPDIVIHTVAKVDVDACEKSPREAFRINRDLTRELVRLMPPRSKIVFLSTDQVFDGRKPFARETDITHPINVYGKSKLAGEEVIRSSGKPYLIIRTNFFGWSAGRKKTFGEWLVQSLRQKKPIRLFKDFYFTPLYAGEVAESVGRLLKKRAEGTLHLVGRNRVSKYEFGQILAKTGRMHFSPTIGGKLREDTALAPRPKDLSLNFSKAEAFLGRRMPLLVQSLTAFFRDEHRWERKKPLSGKRLLAIPYARQTISSIDVRYLHKVLKSDFLTQGPEIERFEKEFSDYVGSKYSVACSSATAGLHLSAMALGVGPGDLWWTSPNTFCATADAARRCGAEVNFIDIKWGTYNMDLGLLEDRLRQAARKNRLPKVVAPVHFAGNPVDLDFLGSLRKRYGFKVVEDSAHATGATFQGEKIGSCRWSDLCVFSFHAVKIITTGEGGMVTTNSAELYEKLLRLRTHGISRDPRHRPASHSNPWYYEKLELGNHYRLTDIQAGLGRSQLSRIGNFLRRRREITKIYDSELKSTGLEMPETTRSANSSWHLYVVCVPESWGPRARNQILQKLRENGVYANLHYTPVQVMNYYRNQVSGRYFPCLLAEQYGEAAISLPIFPGLKKGEQAMVVENLKKCSKPFRI
jgi:UDP-4-amino-4,6-dideoxy-N-acetyl-beta-L-altrosamine transaminase/dTDP-4-dehydrorhamnose reductase